MTPRETITDSVLLNGLKMKTDPQTNIEIRVIFANELAESKKAHLNALATNPTAPLASNAR